jgi:predicted nucleic acid-binding protein
MAARTEAFVDTAALIAFADRSDSYHPLFRGLFADPPPLVTTPLVIAEGHGWFLRRFDGTRALQFMALVEALSLEPLSILPVGPAEQRAGTALLRRFADQALTLTDAVSLHLMKQRRVRSCWSTDRHLRLLGTPLVVDRRS